MVPRHGHNIVTTLRASIQYDPSIRFMRLYYSGTRRDDYYASFGTIELNSLPRELMHFCL